MRRVERALGFLEDPEQLPDHRLGVLDLLDAARSVGSQVRRAKRRPYGIGSAKMTQITGQSTAAR